MEKGARESEKDYESLDKILFIPTSYDEDMQKALEGCYDKGVL